MEHIYRVSWERATGRAYRRYSRDFDEVQKAIDFARAKHADGARFTRIWEEEVEHYETGNNAPGVKDGVRVNFLGFVNFLPEAL